MLLTAPPVQAMAEVMAKAKAFKAARQAQHEEDQGEMDRLDAAYASLLQACLPCQEWKEMSSHDPHVLLPRLRLVTRALGFCTAADASPSGIRGFLGLPCASLVAYS